ncbi:MAG: class I SAM-dependent methyltransferase [Verrucomicrobiota bacterium]
MDNDVLGHNRRAWDERVRESKRHTSVASDDDFKNPLLALDRLGWLPHPLKDRRVLCLASGGGRQAALFAALGARVTVVDISPAMLEQDRKVAAERGLELQTVEASMDNLSALADDSFDVVVQPVSTCYVPDIRKVYAELARVLVAGGLYLSKHKQPINLQASLRPGPLGYTIMESYYAGGPLPPCEPSLHREAGTLEFLHRWGDLLGGLCRAGFIIEDVVEPRYSEKDAKPGTFGHRSAFVPPYIEFKARRLATCPGEGPKLWTPGVA